MVGVFQSWMKKFVMRGYSRRQSLILVNGLTEQTETWFRNHHFWRKYFDVYMPNILVYEGEILHRRIEQGGAISVDYLVEQLYTYLTSFVQSPPYHLVASSLGGKITVEFAARYPELVSRLVLLCPSGMGDEEKLPIVEGVRRSDPSSVVNSVVVNPRTIDPDMLKYYQAKFSSKRWRIGLIRTIRGTMDHCVRERLRDVPHPTLLVSGKRDSIVDPKTAAEAVKLLPQGQYLNLDCGHAPHIEKAWLVNRLVLHFLTSERPSPSPRFRELFWSTPNTIL